MSHFSRTPRASGKRTPSAISRGGQPLCGVSDSGSDLPLRIVFHGLDGVGKTSFAAQFPSPVFLYSAGDTGLETLLDAGRLAHVAHFAAIEEWDGLASCLAELHEAAHDYQTVVVDGLGGFERLCHEKVCARDFDGQWGELGFHGYQRGYEVATTEWRRMLAGLELLRTERRMTVILLAPSRTVAYRNPVGADYDRFCPDLHSKTWGITQHWADIVGFLSDCVGTTGNRRSRRHSAALPGRRLCFERAMSFDAKNRPGLPAELLLPSNDPLAAYALWEQAWQGVRASSRARTRKSRRPATCPIEQAKSA